jgi:transcriptional regulator of acetoin/glycerol metabolism
LSWQTILDLIRDEAGPELAARIEARARHELSGVRIAVPATNRPRPTEREIQAALKTHRWNVARAAEALGLHPSALYGRLRPGASAETKPAEPRLIR